MWVIIQHIQMESSAEQPLCMTTKSTPVCSVGYRPDTPVIMYPFRLMCDDDEVLAVGLSSDDSSFDPLDDYGKGAFGCNQIEYFDRASGLWKQL